MHKNEKSSLYNFIALCSFSYYFVQSFSQKVFEVSTWNFIGGLILLRRGAAHKNDNLPCIIFQLFPFVIFSHPYSHRFQICNHFSHQFLLPKYLLKWNYSALLYIHSSNEQTHSAGDGHVDMALVKTYFILLKMYTWTSLAFPSFSLMHISV
jgi:hypothetical protein